MKNGPLTLLCLILIMSCTQKKQDTEKTHPTIFYPEVEQRTLIIGQINNYHKFTDIPKIIELSVNDITINNRHTYNLEIDGSGKFVFDIPLYNPTISYIYYGDFFISPYLFPNDTIFLKFDLYKNGNKLKAKAINYDEKHNEFQKNFKRFHQWIFYQNSGFRKKISSNSNPQKLKEEYLNFEKEIFEKIEDISKKDSLNDILTDFLICRSKYSIYNELISVGSKIENEDERREFFTFLNDSVVFNKNAILCDVYQFFLHNYQFNVNRPFKAKADSLCKNEEFNSLESITNQLNHYFSQRNGVWAEFLAASYLYNNITKEEFDKLPNSSFMTLINNYFEDGYIRQLLLSTWKDNSNKDVLLMEKPIPKEAKLKKYNSLSGEKLLERIIADNKGRVIYIDIWATWCVPCKRQIPHSIRLHEIFDGEKVSFVYFCCRSEEETWEKNIKLYQVKGNHILLNKEQNDFLKTRFSITGIPRYLLVDKNGEIVDIDAPRPDSEKILRDIKSLINR